MDDLNALVAPYLGIALIALAVACVVLVVAVIVLARRTSRARPAAGRRDARLGGEPRVDPRRAPRQGLRGRPRGRRASAARTAVLEATQRRALQRIGLVRFNPFEDTGGNQSFALALLDAHGNGLVVSSLHSRTGTRVYGKAITGGRGGDGAVATRRARRCGWRWPPGAGPARAADADARRDTQAGTGARHRRGVAPDQPTLRPRPTRSAGRPRRPRCDEPASRRAANRRRSSRSPSGATTRRRGAPRRRARGPRRAARRA